MGKETSRAVQYCTNSKEMIPTTEITEQAVADIRKLDDWDAAALFDARLIELEKAARHSFIEMGIVCLEVRKRELWKLIEASDWIEMDQETSRVVQRCTNSKETSRVVQYVALTATSR